LCTFLQNLGKANRGNVLLSPISIKLALVLLYEGAQDQTAHELARAMQLPINPVATRDKFNNILKSLQVNYTLIYKLKVFNIYTEIVILSRI